MVNAEVFSENPLDEMLAYYYMDLDWCYRVKEKGYRVGVHHGTQIGHTYLRNRDAHPIRAIRSQLRNYWTPISQRHMTEKGRSELQGQILTSIEQRSPWELRQTRWYELRHHGLRRTNKPWPKAADLHWPLIDTAIE